MELHNLPLKIKRGVGILVLEENFEIPTEYSIRMRSDDHFVYVVLTMDLKIPVQYYMVFCCLSFVVIMIIELGGSLCSPSPPDLYYSSCRSAYML